MQLNFANLAAHRNPMIDEIVARARRKPRHATASPNPDSASLSSFNGYYILSCTGGGDTVPGMFLSIDTNISAALDSGTNTYTAAFDVTIIVCLDGATPQLFDFTLQDAATFTKQPDGNYKLAFDLEASGTSFELVFTRAGLAAEATAGFTGTMTTGGQQVAVAGTTYNNPILPALYSGNYYTQQTTEAASPILTIGRNFELAYSPYVSTGSAPPATAVASYTYNMNMYFFSFTDTNGNDTKLIMGTSAASGMVCNNLTVVGGTAIPRELTTIQQPDQGTAPTSGVQLNDRNAAQVAAMAGYFPLTPAGGGTQPGATVENGPFLSIEGQYVSSYLPLATPTIDVKYKTIIGICIDGIHTAVSLYDSTCSFDANVLTVPGESGGVQGKWVMTFTPGYTAGTGAYSQFGNLNAVSMTFQPDAGHASPPAPVTYAGECPLGPVPLSAFAGPKMTSTNGTNECLQVLTDYSLLYTPPAAPGWDPVDQQQAWLQILYVPLMYILVYQARPADILASDPSLASCMLSLGTNGAHGLASINTRYIHVWPGVPPIPLPPTSVEAIPGTA